MHTQYQKSVDAIEANSMESSYNFVYERDNNGILPPVLGSVLAALAIVTTNGSCIHSLDLLFKLKLWSHRWGIDMIV